MRDRCAATFDWRDSMADDSFHSRTHGTGWSKYSELINTGESSKRLLVRVPESALVLIDIHNEQVLKLVAKIEAWKAFAEHQEWCGACADSVQDCPVGSFLREAAQPAGAADREPGAQPSTVDEDRNHKVRGG